MSDKKKSISKKSIVHLVILGLILFLGTGVAGGFQLYKQNLKIYKDAADSYVNMLCYQIGNVDINGIIQHQEEICDFREKLSVFLNDKEADHETYEQLLDETDEEIVNVYNQWNEVDSFILGFGNICNDIRYAYVVIPTDQDLVYMWDSQIEMTLLYTPFSHAPYSGKEKEHIMAAMRGDLVSDFFTEDVDGELLGTALSPVWDENGQIRAVAAIDISVSSIRSASLKLLLHVGIAILLIMMVSITVYHYVIRKQIIDPIVLLTKATDGFVNNLQRESSEPFHVDVQTGNEIDVLARSFERMDLKLLDYIRENAAITAEKERIGTELALATRIQMDMLPRIFPPFPNIKEIDLYASMDPAKEVGGDFYDYFMVDEKQLWLVVADVSGKGIPAALFMMMSKIMVQNFAQTLKNPGEVLEQVNNQICNNTREEMFVTVWLGVLDLQTGLVTAANAGHEYPVLKEPGGDYRLVKDKHGLVVGGMAGYHYREYQLRLQPGSRLFVYTDGLPEASNDEEEMFGIERTLKVLNEVKEGSPREVLQHVSQAAADFVGRAPQFDDMTMLCLDYYGEKGEKGTVPFS